MFIAHANVLSKTQTKRVLGSSTAANKGGQGGGGESDSQAYPSSSCSANQRQLVGAVSWRHLRPPHVALLTLVRLIGDDGALGLVLRQKSGVGSGQLVSSQAGHTAVGRMGCAHASHLEHVPQALDWFGPIILPNQLSP